MFADSELEPHSRIFSDVRAVMGANPQSLVWYAFLSNVNAGGRARKFNRVPIRLTTFGDEFRVLRAAKPNADLLGARLLESPAQMHTLGVAREAAAAEYAFETTAGQRVERRERSGHRGDRRRPAPLVMSR